MASKSVSPTANLLRQSRLFSLPQRLPEAPIQPLSVGDQRSSPNATKPYPLLQAVETTPAGLHRGDWGFKRALPKKKTQNTSTPVVRVNEIDSIDHVTDYESAADHYLTLKKWQEMQIPIVNDTGELMRTQRMTRLTSVFEERYHNTERKETLSRGTRWKFKGPWIDGLSPGEFRDYINKEIKNRRPEFTTYSKSWLSKRRTAAREAAAAEKSEPFTDPGPLTEAEYQQEMSRIRKDPTDLWALVWDFLDLPGNPPGAEKPQDRQTFNDTVDTYTSPWQKGPPLTHPSAGLSYIRSNNVIPNHPTLGPMRYQPPVEGRILEHSNPQNRMVGTHMVGVGGVVTKIGSYGTMNVSAAGNADPAANQEARFEAALEGGAKSWVEPMHATIEANGRIRLAARQAHADSVAVWEHRVDKKQKKESVGNVFGDYSKEITMDARQGKTFGLKGKRMTM